MAKTVTMGDNVFDCATKTWSKGEPDFSKGFIAPQNQWDAVGLGDLGRRIHADTSRQPDAKRRTKDRHQARNLKQNSLSL